MKTLVRNTAEEDQMVILSCRVCDFSTNIVEDWQKHFDVPEPGRTVCKIGILEKR